MRESHGTLPAGCTRICYQGAKSQQLLAPDESLSLQPARANSTSADMEDMRLWRESAAYERGEEAERIGELIGAGYAEDWVQMTPERRAYPLELFRLEVVRGDYFRRDDLRVHGGESGENGSSPYPNYLAVRWTARDKGSRRFLQTAQSVLTAASRPRPASTL
jgi:hypothetical protein